jgi:hypothetical protein
MKFYIESVCKTVGQIHCWLKYDDTRDMLLEYVLRFMIISRRIIYRLKKNLRRNF